jgi:hypothetical protein
MDWESLITISDLIHCLVKSSSTLMCLTPASMLYFLGSEPCMYSSRLYNLWVQCRIRYVIQGSDHDEARGNLPRSSNTYVIMYNTDFGNWQT